MAKVNCYYDKGKLFGLTYAPSFYAYPVEVDGTAVQWAEQLRALIAAEVDLRKTTAFPSGVQELADTMASEMGAIMKIRKRKVDVSSKDTKSTDE